VAGHSCEGWTVVRFEASSCEVFETAGWLILKRFRRRKGNGQCIFLEEH
jgi:hypothetical protein